VTSAPDRLGPRQELTRCTFAFWDTWRHASTVVGSPSAPASRALLALLACEGIRGSVSRYLGILAPAAGRGRGGYRELGMEPPAAGG